MSSICLLLSILLVGVLMSDASRLIPFDTWRKQHQQDARRTPVSNVFQDGQILMHHDGSYMYVLQHDESAAEESLSPQGKFRTPRRRVSNLQSADPLSVTKWASDGGEDSSGLWYKVLLVNYHEQHEKRAALLEKMASDMQELPWIEAVQPASHHMVLVKIHSDYRLKIDQVIPQLAKHSHVHWIERKVENIRHNRDAQWVTTTNDKSSADQFASMLRGENQIVGVGDSGLDANHCFFHDREHAVNYLKGNDHWQFDTSNHRKIVGYHTLVDDVAEDEAHGTHVTGTIVGESLNTQLINGTSLSEYNGIAAKGKVAFMDIGCTRPEGCPCSGIACECDLYPDKKCPASDRAVYPPLSLSEGYFPFFYASGAKVSTHSWGGGAGLLGYSSDSMEIDQFTWKHKDHLVLFSAGNSADVLGYASLGTQAEAKNALTVGASMNVVENFRFAADHIIDYDARAKKIAQSLFEDSDCKRILNATLDGETCQTYQPEVVEFCNYLKNDLIDEESCCSKQYSACMNDTMSCGCTTKYGEMDVASYCCGKCSSQRYKSFFSQFIYSKENQAYFSSQGPTVDGRIKPDVTNVGYYLNSAKAHNTLTDPYSCPIHSETSLLKDQLFPAAGTSMSSPLTAANALLVNEYFSKGFYPSGSAKESNAFSPSSALMKSILIQSAIPLQGTVDTQYGTFPVHGTESSSVFLNAKFIEGFGRVQLSNALFIDGISENKLYVHRDGSDATMDPVVKTGESHSVCFTLPVDSSLKATLVWTDYPSTPSSKKHLVNDLDLLMKKTDSSSIFSGNHENSFGPNEIRRDVTNNVEQINLHSAPRGEYVIRVEGSSIYTDEQPFALTITAPDLQVHECSASVSDEASFYTKSDDGGSIVPSKLNDATLTMVVAIGFIVIFAALLVILIASLVSCFVLINNQIKDKSQNVAETNETSNDSNNQDIMMEDQE